MTINVIYSDFDGSRNKYQTVADSEIPVLIAGKHAGHFGHPDLFITNIDFAIRRGEKCHVVKVVSVTNYELTEEKKEEITTEAFDLAACVLDMHEQ